MTEWLTARAFHRAGGVEDWRVLYWGAHAFYLTPSYAVGARFVGEVAAIAEELDHRPDVDLRPHGVVVRSFTAASGRISAADLELARRVSGVARDLGLAADPSRLQTVGLAVASPSGPATRPFWAAALGYDPLDDADAVDPQRRDPHLWFQETPAVRAGHGRFHVDVAVPADQAGARVQAALAAGGRLVDGGAEQGWWTLASPENHKVDIAAWPDAEDGEERDEEPPPGAG